MALSFTLISLIITYAVIHVVNSQWTSIWYDLFNSKDAWECHKDKGGDCQFGWTGIIEAHCEDTVCHRLRGPGWIDMSWSLSSLCGASCAGWPLRLRIYVDAINHDVNGDGCSIRSAYDSDNWSNEWECGYDWNKPFCDDMNGNITIDLPSSSDRSTLSIALSSECSGTNEYCTFDNLELEAYIPPPTPEPTTKPTKPTPKPTPNPTRKPTPNPTRRPTPNPTPKPTPNPTPNPTPRPTTKPTNPHTATCQDIVSGSYNNEVVTFIIHLPYEGDLQFDASPSTFPITDIEAFTMLNMPLATDTNGDENVWLYDKPAGDYKFIIDSSTHASGTFIIHIQCVSADPTPYPTLKPIAAPNPTLISTPNPTRKPTPNPTVKPTPNPTPSPTPSPTPKPTDPGTSTCDDVISGTYHGTPVTFMIHLPYEGDLKFDASPSNFPISGVEAYSKLNIRLGTDSDGDNIIWLYDQPSGDYKFLIDSDSSTSGTFIILIECVSANPTSSPTYSPSKYPTLLPNTLSQLPTKRPTNSPVNPTKTPNTSPSDILSCDDNAIGTYSGAPISLRIVVPFQVKVIFDASLSNFAINTMQVFDTFDSLLAFSNSDQDAILSFIASVHPVGEYIFIFGGAPGVSGFYHVEITCVDDSIKSTKEQKDNDNEDLQSLIGYYRSTDGVVIISAIALAICCVFCCIMRIVCKLYKRKRKAIPEEMLTELPQPHAGLQMATGVVPIDDSDSEPDVDVARDRTRAHESDLVSIWLRDVVDLPQYIPNFILNGYESLAVIAQITNTRELKKMGIGSNHHQTKIMIAIGKLEEDDGDQPEGATWGQLRRTTKPRTNDHPKDTLKSTDYNANYHGSGVMKLEESMSSSSSHANDLFQTTSSRHDKKQCVDCSQVKEGRIFDENGQFYCHDCWQNYGLVSE
eukprot:646972_1